MSKDIVAELDRIMHPRSVAIIGASAKEGKVGRLFMDCFIDMGFEELYPVNPRESEVLGFKAYASVKDIPGDVDLAYLLTPPEAVIDAVRECAEKGLKGVVITTAGFGERGEEGKKLEKEIAEIARESGTRVIGPNCVGIYCPSSKLPFPLRPGKQSGSVGVISQSGSFADLLTWTATAKGIGFSKAVSCGNECDLNAVDFLEYLGKDPETKMIIAYLEGVKDGKRFCALARRISETKPIIVWKCGRTEGGAKAAFSHTGALAGSSAVWEAVLKQAGIISVDSYEEVLDSMFAFYYLPPPRGRKVAIVTGPGGPAVGASDACLELGLELAELSAETRARIAEVIPPAGTSTANPVDLSIAVLLSPLVYRDAIKILGQDENVDLLLVIGIGDRRFSEVLLEAVPDMKKPLALTLAMGPEMVPEEYQFLFEKGVPAYPDPRRAAKALARLVEYEEFRAGN